MDTRHLSVNCHSINNTTKEKDVEKQGGENNNGDYIQSINAQRVQP